MTFFLSLGSTQALAGLLRSEAVPDVLPEVVRQAEKPTLKLVMGKAPETVPWFLPFVKPFALFLGVAIDLMVCPPPAYAPETLRRGLASDDPEEVRTFVSEQGPRPLPKTFVDPHNIVNIADPSKGPTNESSKTKNRGSDAKEAEELARYAFIKTRPVQIYVLSATDLENLTRLGLSRNEVETAVAVLETTSRNIDEILEALPRIKASNPVEDLKFKRVVKEIERDRELARLFLLQFQDFRGMLEAVRRLQVHTIQLHSALPQEWKVYSDRVLVERIAQATIEIIHLTRPLGYQKASKVLGLVQTPCEAILQLLADLKVLGKIDKQQSVHLDQSLGSTTNSVDPLVVRLQTESILYPYEGEVTVGLRIQFWQDSSSYVQEVSMIVPDRVSDDEEGIQPMPSQVGISKAPLIIEDEITHVLPALGPNSKNVTGRIEKSSNYLEINETRVDGTTLITFTFRLPS